ncbi:MAG: hypothetical protein RBS43_08215 [Candidatus Cloacimonas sp.]|jgi:hypothetical protein|nr:hypothetical protein [Candidatus Cloacimonas sp.]
MKKVILLFIVLVCIGAASAQALSILNLKDAPLTEETLRDIPVIGSYMLTRELAFAKQAKQLTVNLDCAVGLSVVVCWSVILFNERSPQ